MSLLFFLLRYCLISPLTSQGTIQSPDQYLPHALGARFTPHHLIVDYFNYVDAQSDKVRLFRYGTTYEDRPLITAIVSSPDNLKQLEAIRKNHLQHAGLMDGTGLQENKVIVWLSYSVHGNEPAGAESAMAVLYDLVQGDPRADEWLKNTVVILDPVLNPDGFDRYVQWINGVSARSGNPRTAAREHHEPWPGGRTNHYYFDLNRDWVWQTQQESRQRLSFYQEWMPHIHADVHEMSSADPYYFAPAAQPYHPDVTPWQTEFQVMAGKNHAAYFDREGWRYFTRERFDLFYPSYGDTYPTFSGAVGMTYEQGGGSFAGFAVQLEHGDTLTLADRIAHHRTASISTVEVASRNAAKLIREFASYFSASAKNTSGEFRTYVISGKNHPERLADFLKLLDLHHIRYGRMTSDMPGIEGFNYQHGVEASFDAMAGDIVIPAKQPRAVLAHILMEPEGHLSDSLTYDITAWSLPMAYALKAFATTTTLKADTTGANQNTSAPAIPKPYAYALPWGSVSAASMLGHLLERGLVARYALHPFVTDGIAYPSGTVLLMRGDNRKNSGFDALVSQVSASFGMHVYPIRSGLVDSGKDFGSEDYRVIGRPEVLTLAGPEVKSSSLGEIWHFFEENLNYPLHIINVEQFPQVQLNQYTTLILPEGSYAFTATIRDQIQKWVQQGGKMIAIGNAIQKLTSIPGVSVSIRKNEQPDSSHAEDLVHLPLIYNTAERSSLSDNIPGTIFKTTMDPANPLGFGLGDQFWTLRTGTLQFNWLQGAGNAIFLGDSPHHFGFAGYRALATTRRTLVAGQEGLGAGSIVYLPDNPLFRSFWYAGKVLFANALFF